jgi:hypothetical protein
MSGLRINYQKSEVFGVGIDQEDLVRAARMLNCEVGTFPMKYLGLPISGDKILVKDLDFVPEKLVKKLANGCSIQASSGGKAILIDSCMDNLATYAMSFFLLYEQAHAKMDSVRARLFWEGFGEKKKYHMVRWDTLCKPKDFGGLGFVDSRVRNICLMSKWIYKLESGSEDLSCQILRNKYLRGAGFYQSSEVGGSQFWKSLHKIKKWVCMGFVYKAGNGRKCFFWHDVWLGDCPLKIQFPVLFSCCGQPDGTVAEVFDGQRWDLSFNRSLEHMGVAEWQAMNILLSGVVISDQEDMVS